jgi:hypothetical protein
VADCRDCATGRPLVGLLTGFTESECQPITDAFRERMRENVKTAKALGSHDSGAAADRPDELIK